MNLNLANKRVLITGGSRGIGYEMARSFLCYGAEVVILGRSLVNLDEAATQLAKDTSSQKIHFYSIDCSDSFAWAVIMKDVVEKLGGLDIAIANVGDGRGSQEALPDAEAFSASWKVNFITAEETARSTIPLLKATNGSFLFVSSIAGIEAIGAPTPYSVAKTAIISLTKQLARRLAPSVRVNCVVPGNIYFKGGSWEEKMTKDPSKVEAIIQSSVPMKRFGKPEEVADAAVFLCSERASFITGSCLIVDGGQTVSIL
ncbi:MAG TPA: SDR family oxidoreductase [Sphingobacteriaceae bacterium]